MKLTQHEKNQRLAERAGVIKSPTPPYHLVDAEEAWPETPSYFTDLNEVHELEMRLGNSTNPTSALWWQYITTLTKICGDVPAIFATAAQRADALGLTLGLWKEGE